MDGAETQKHAERHTGRQKHGDRDTETQRKRPMEVETHSCASRVIEKETQRDMGKDIKRWYRYAWKHMARVTPGQTHKGPHRETD